MLRAIGMYLWLLVGHCGLPCTILTLIPSTFILMQFRSDRQLSREIDHDREAS